MLAVIAVILFVVAVFRRSIGDVDMLAAGLAFLAAHHAVGDRLRW